MQNYNLDPILIHPQQGIEPHASVIFMHGLGADATDLVDLVSALDLPQNLGIRFVFPNAPSLPITRAAGFSMRAWFDIGYDIETSVDETGIRNSTQLINKLITKELNSGIASNKIILAGFSQGGVMAMQCGLRYPKTLGGILVLSGFLLLQDKLVAEIDPSNQTTPILMLHGKQDPLIPIKYAEQSFATLKKMGLNIDFQTYNMEHAICEPEINTIATWIKQILM